MVTGGEVRVVESLRASVAPISLHPLTALVELLRRDHVAVDPQGAKLAFQSEAKAARHVLLPVDINSELARAGADLNCPAGAGEASSDVN